MKKRQWKKYYKSTPHAQGKRFQKLVKINSKLYGAVYYVELITPQCAESDGYWNGDWVIDE